MKYYPLFLDIIDRRCVVIGGGDVAERKVERLLDFGARVVVVGKTLTPGLETMKKEGRINHIAADYDKALIDDAFLLIGATDRDDVNAKISRDGKEKGILVNIVDDPDKCDFVLPSLLTQGDLLIAISTGGKSPALAKKLKGRDGTALRDGISNPPRRDGATERKARRKRAFLRREQAPV